MEKGTFFTLLGLSCSMWDPALCMNVLLVLLGFYLPVTSHHPGSSPSVSPCLDSDTPHLTAFLGQHPPHLDRIPGLHSGPLQFLPAPGKEA